MQLPPSLRRAAVAGALVTAVAAAAPTALADTSQRVLVLTTGKSKPYGSESNGAPLVSDFASAREDGVYDLTRYAFTVVQPDAFSAASLAGQDTLFLYGIRFQDSRLSADDKAAINDFARTHKVLIWDADAFSGVSVYDDFIYPFTEVSSGEREARDGTAQAAPTYANVEPLVSSDATAGNYIDTSALAGMRHTVGDANMMDSFGDGWQRSILAANDAPGMDTLRPLVAWHYGVGGERTGKIIYSGVGVDALDVNKPLEIRKADQGRCTNTAADMTAAPSCVNWALRLLDVQLQAGFRTTPDACAPSCPNPDAGSVDAGSTGNAAATSGPATSTPSTASDTPITSTLTPTSAPAMIAASSTAAGCSFAARPPVRWVRGSVALRVRSQAPSATRVLLSTVRGLALGSASLRGGLFTLRLDTHRLPSNRTSSLVASVLTGSVRSCSLSLRLRVDNTAPRALKLAERRVGATRIVSFRPSESVKASVFVGFRKLRVVMLSPARRASLRLPARTVRLVLADRAGNTTVRLLHLR